MVWLIQLTRVWPSIVGCVSVREIVSAFATDAGSVIVVGTRLRHAIRLGDKLQHYIRMVRRQRGRCCSLMRRDDG
jgi:hypothetical protein